MGVSARKGDGIRSLCTFLGRGSGEGERDMVVGLVDRNGGHSWEMFNYL